MNDRDELPPLGTPERAASDKKQAEMCAGLLMSWKRHYQPAKDAEDANKGTGRGKVHARDFADDL